MGEAIMFVKLLSRVSIASVLALFSFIAHADHSWNDYHWARTTGSFTLKTVDQTTFTADLNGTDVSASFAPVPGKTETVMIPLSPGSNTLILRINGATASGRIATDTDRLVFLVQ
jgi:hypothetical protein